jgi:hypothetical protein
MSEYHAHAQHQNHDTLSMRVIYVISCRHFFCFFAGPSKKLGKAAAAKAALAKLYNITFSPFTSLLQPNGNFGSSGAPPVSFEQMALPQVLADHICTLSVHVTEV